MFYTRELSTWAVGLFQALFIGSLSSGNTSIVWVDNSNYWHLNKIIFITNFIKLIWSSGLEFIVHTSAQPKACLCKHPGAAGYRRVGHVRMAKFPGTQQSHLTNARWSTGKTFFAFPGEFSSRLEEFAAGGCEPTSSTHRSGRRAHDSFTVSSRLGKRTALSSRVCSEGWRYLYLANTNKFGL